MGFTLVGRFQKRLEWISETIVVCQRHAAKSWRNYEGGCKVGRCPGNLDGRHMCCCREASIWLFFEILNWLDTMLQPEKKQKHGNPMFLHRKGDVKETMTSHDWDQGRLVGMYSNSKEVESYLPL